MPSPPYLQPAYHSVFNDKDAAQLCGMAMLPLKTRVRGPAPQLDVASAEEDQIDEAIRLFRANVLFRNFEVLGAADRTLIYLTLLIHQVRPSQLCERLWARH
jgi:actin related protein 2/3 complex subunit 3